MPRKTRVCSRTGVYHVILRGINRQQIFIDEEDNRIFLQILKTYKTVCDYKILAYCLMGNHIHLLIKEGSESLSRIFKRIGAKYVYGYNTKYQRVGHLFQGRFKSEPVENERYLCAVICYIHQNPVKAGLCKTPEEYPYSSMSEYLGEQGLVDKDTVNQLLPIQYLIQQSKSHMVEGCLEMSNILSRRLTDQDALKLIRELTKCGDPTSFQNLPAASQKRCLSKMRKSGASIRQLSRLTGLTYYFIQKTGL